MPINGNIKDMYFATKDAYLHKKQSQESHNVFVMSSKKWTIT